MSIFQELTKEQKNIIDLLQKRGPQTKQVLTLLTNMKLSTLNRIMLPIEEDGIVLAQGSGDSTGGRKPVLFDVNESSGYIIGVEISRTTLMILITNLKLKIIEKKIYPINEASTPYQVINSIIQSIQHGIESHGLSKDLILGIGVGAVGPLDRANGIIINPTNFPAVGWVNVPIKTAIEQALGLSVMVDNGTNAALLAEFYHGMGRHYENIAYINCGIGIRTSALSDGRIVRGVSDAEDAFGHMIVDADGIACYCGNYGCIECYASIRAITQAYRASVKRGRSASITKPLSDVSYLDICSAASQSDCLCREIVLNAAAMLGTGLSNYINLLNPMLIILSGPLIQASDLYYQISTETAIQKSYFKGKSQIVFNRGGQLGKNAIAVGAAAMVFQDTFSS